MPDLAISTRFVNAWNAFLGRDPAKKPEVTQDLGYSTSYRPDRPYFSRGNERSIVASVYNRIAMDCAAIKVEHVRTDEEGRYSETMKSEFNNCLTLSANFDQTSQAFMQDVVMSMFDEGHVVILPVDTTTDPMTGSYDILSLRTGKVVQWYPSNVKVNAYDERSGKRRDIIVSKEEVAIIENPLYAVMNQPNSTLQRLKHTLFLVDKVNSNNSANKLDLIIQMPYTIKSDARRKQAEQRRNDIEMQLTSSQYGVAYTDATEKVVQLNRSLENQLWNQATDLTTQLYNQLGLTQKVFDGTASEDEMQNYYTRTIDPIMSAITKEMIRKFITKTARSQGQSIMYFRSPFALVTASAFADIANKFISSEVITSNEARSELGYKPSSDPRADQLLNKNINTVEQSNQAAGEGEEEDQTTATGRQATEDAISRLK